MKLHQGNVFTPVCHSVHRGVSVTPLGRHPLGRHPLDRHPLGRHPWADIPLGRPPVQTPPGQTPPLPGQTHTPWADTPCTVHAGMWSTSRRYASYWNAFLLLNILSFWTNNVTNFPKVIRLMSLPICCFRFSIFVLETLKFEWQCNQYLQLNPT